MRLVILIMMMFTIVKPVLGQVENSNAKKAEDLAIALAKIDYAQLEDRLVLNVFSVLEQENQVKVELGVGTIHRPAKIRNCITITFENEFVQKIENDIDAGVCNF